MSIQLTLSPDTIKGFLDPAEGEALYRAGIEVSALGPCLEIGSYCGKSTLYLGSACKACENTLFALDHHRGSEEHQIGEEYFDRDLYDQRRKQVDSFPLFRETIDRAGLAEYVVPLVAPSKVVARHWKTPLGLIFIDGGHSLEAAKTDFECWTPHLVHGGLLAIHDIFPNPADGGQAPYEIYKQALKQGDFTHYNQVKTLGLLRKN